jgi:putative intracellular protease/amidase
MEIDMTKIITILTDGFADWETALINAGGSTFYGFETAYATPGGVAVRSSGGLRAMADLAIENIDVNDLDVLLVCGGTIWATDDAPDVSGLLRRAHEAGKVVGVICDATLQLAKSGLIDTRPHTSNAPGFLDATGYGGAALYRNGAEAVAADRIVTAPGTSPVSFMAAVLEALGLADGNLDFYVGLHAAQYGAVKVAA